MKTGDASYIKQLNRKILLEEIIRHQSISRSELARVTGLNKATVSSQVSEFLKQEIIVEKHDARIGNRGRRPILLELNGEAGFSIGIDIDANELSVLFMNLKGDALHSFKTEITFNHIAQITNQLIDLLSPTIEKYKSIYKPLGLIGIGVGIHGIVNNEQEIIFTPTHEWSNIAIREQLEEALKAPVYIDNNANLSVFAEQVFGEHSPNLFCVTLYSGIGLGIMNENKIYRGFQGFAGEIGHMVVESEGLPCPCGNKGCWELYASEKALLSSFQEKNPDFSLTDIKTLHYNSESDVLDHYIHYLAIGLNNIINIFNPETIILNGAMINENLSFIVDITQRLQSKMNHYKEIRASKLGQNSCILGGAAMAIRNFLEIDTMDFTAHSDE